MKRVLFILAVVCLISIFAGVTHADGKYFPAKAYRTSPTIHSQRAILKYKDGVETLVIESSFDGEGKDFGWVIPLPARPSKFEEASPGFLETLSQTIQPYIMGGFGMQIIFSFFWPAIVLLFFISSLFSKDRTSVVSSFVLLVLLFLFSSLMMSSLGGTKNAGFSSRIGVDVLDIQEVGGLSIVVLDADNSDVLNSWLQDNEFVGLNDTERSIVTDYIKDKWCFVAAKLKRDGKGYTQPHPLAMTFEVDKPVYPMKLTAAANSDVYLELFVIADNYASYPLLTTEYSKHLFRGKTHDKKLRFGEIGHPDSDQYLWDKCVITRLCDVLGPEDMKQDIFIDLSDGEDVHKFYYTHRGAFDLGLMLGLRVWCIAVIVLTIWFNRKKTPVLGTKAKFKKILLPSTCVLIVIYAVVYFKSSPKISGVEIPKGGIGSRYTGVMVENGIKAEIHEGTFDNCKNVADLEKKLKDDVFPGIVLDNSKYINEIKLEDSPGNVVVLEDDRGLVIRVFESGGFYDDVVLSEKAKGR